MSSDFRVYSLIDTNPKTVALTGNNSVLVRYYSTAEIVLDISGGGNLNLDTCFIRNGNKSQPATYTNGRLKATFENVESNTFVVSGEDSEGNYIQKDIITDMVEYTKLTCYIGNNRPSGDGTMELTCSGAFFNGYLGAARNALVVQYRYRPYGGSFSAWRSMNVSLGTNYYNAYATLTGLDYRNSYTFEVMASDSLEDINVSTAGVRSTPVFHWGENDFQFEVPVGMKAGAQVTGDMYVSGDVLFDSGSDVSISHPFPDTLLIKAPTLSLNSDNLYLGGVSLEQGTWTPDLFWASGYKTLQGWYTKIGNIVTVGFFIKANCPSGYHETNIQITGLPYTPLYSAAGGGMCSKAYVGKDNIFQCFVAETNGYIGTRVQTCNSEANRNLETYGSGCNYPYGGGELTLSGTITYMTA